MTNDDDWKQCNVSIRHGVIADFVGSAWPDYGDNERQLHEKS